jgi:hypothetical protein
MIAIRIIQMTAATSSDAVMIPTCRTLLILYTLPLVW